MRISSSSSGSRSSPACHAMVGDCKTTCDGALAEFASPLDAVRSAMEIQGSDDQRRAPLIAFRDSCGECESVR